jgi:uncharacterized circularly permuted ATP-grasp superfamily protein/uncharacterized alpha-E superfamily protein
VLTRTSLIENYRPVPGSYDEMASPLGVPRPHWARFLERLEALGAEKINRRWDLAARLIRDDDVYQADSDAGLSEFWSLDLMPFLVSAADWAVIESAVIQRAELLDATLGDLYGQQRLLREGVLPADLLFAHPGFLRPVHGLAPPGGRFIHFYAADVARGPDGRWVILADRTQAPSGMGYSLENRIVLTRTFPEIFKNFHVRRLVNFFQQVRQSLVDVAPAGVDNPNIVILTRGSFTPTHFEHVHLARFLGYPLVEPGDLTTRDNRVYVKTLDGLRPVHVIMRHINDAWLDPLELKYDSMVGIAGLVQAVRSGQVSVVNALGSGLIGSYALRSYMGELCRFLRGEELRLPSLPSWWCGTEENEAHVRANLDRLVLKGAFRAVPGDPIFGARLTGEERRAFLERLATSPEDYVAEEYLHTSCTPVWNRDQLAARQSLLRVFAVATPGGYVVMPGGVARIPPPQGSEIVSMNRGGGSKDVWVLSDTPVDSRTLALAQAAGAVTLSRSPTALPSRVADNLFWLGRYVERADCTVRLLRTVLNRMTTDATEGGIPERDALARVLVAYGLAKAPEEDAPAPTLTEEGVLAAVYARTSPMSLRSTLVALRRISWTVRDRLSPDTWRILNRLEGELEDPDSDDMAALTDVYTLMNQLVLTLAAFSGLAMESMTRGPGWHFLDIGRRLERAIALIHLLEVTTTTETEDEPAILQTALEIADSVMTYRSRYLSHLQLDAVLDLLLVDETNPRSLAFQLAVLDRHMDILPAEAAVAGRTEGLSKRLVSGLLRELRQLDPETLAQPAADGRRRRLAELFEHFADQLPEVSDALTRTYFSHTEARQFGDNRPAGDEA